MMCYTTLYYNYVSYITYLEEAPFLQSSRGSKGSLPGVLATWLLQSVYCTLCIAVCVLQSV